MARSALGRDQVHEVAWGKESYPHPLVSCMMPLIVVLAAMALALLGFGIWQRSLPGNVNIPNVAGVPVETAQRRLEDLGLKVEVAKDRKYDEKIPSGAVITTMPPSGRMVKQQRLIRLLISDGSAYTKIPDIEGATLDTAYEQLRKLDLVVTNETAVYDDEVPFNCIISISPKTGMRVARGSTVKLVISKGPERDDEITDMGADPDQRSATLTIAIPEEDAAEAELRIDVIDDSGKRTALRKTAHRGEIVVQTVEGTGKAKAEVYYANRLILTRQM